MKIRVFLSVIALICLLPMRLNAQETVAIGYKCVEQTGDAIVTSEKGMRGVIIYNRKNHRQLFLPVGASGYGRRKDSNGAWAPALRTRMGDLDMRAEVSLTKGEILL